jgi:hypothetical protein
MGMVLLRELHIRYTLYPSAGAHAAGGPKVALRGRSCAEGGRCCRLCCDRREGRLRESCDGEKPSTNKTTNTRTAGVAAGVTVRYGGGIGCVVIVPVQIERDTVRAG